ncbi:MAG: helicase-related protein [Chloroflexi bacterium]|nr:helicase-related protein [Chloroflexota bacterium]
MSKLEDLTPDAAVRGIRPDSFVTVVSAQWNGPDVVTLTYRTPTGQLGEEVLFRDAESRIEVVEQGRPWSFDGDGKLFRLVSEANRIKLAHLFDPVLAVHTSEVEPLPHQITAVYEAMIERQPLRFLLADDPGAGKTIMAGLLIKELIARGDLQRCLVVCPGNLVEQWQDELHHRFSLPFEILTNDKLEAARTGNWFLENDLVIGRLDKLARDDNVQDKLSAPDCQWDLIVCDEAHKMSATFFGGEISYTKRYRLGRLLSNLTRHFLLMTATPHNGKETDFQLFMALLDSDRFEGRFRDGVHTTEVSDLMRRVTKEELVKFDNTPLLPERIAETVPYLLSDGETSLYDDVTKYVSEEFNRAASLQNNKRAGNVGFALTILQRRLASSPEAIYQSLRRRRERLENTMRELETLQRDGDVESALTKSASIIEDEDIEYLEEATDDEVDDIEGELLDRATAASTIAELKAEIATLRRLEALALEVRQSGGDKKWQELANLFANTSMSNEKLVIFTEHRDTLRYLEGRITALLGQSDAIVCIHGSMRREDRAKAQESFSLDPEVQVLLATDAAGEGINLQRAHLMVNYDLPWNPNRIEQRFGRIHRIGQTEVCRLWNLVAQETREGAVYQRLLEKLEEARNALGGKVFDVLGKVHFEGKPLRELLIEAIRYGERPEVRGRLTQVVDNAFEHDCLKDLWEEKALVHDAMDTSHVHRVREQMERAETRRLQPHYIESFFLEAFQHMGGTLREREPRRYRVTQTPAAIRNRNRTVLPRYERIVFEKALKAPQDQPLAAFVCPGHPLLDVTADLLLERNRDLLRRGAVLVDEKDQGLEPRVLFYLDHAIQDATTTRSGERRVVSKRMLYVELDAEGNSRHPHYAPYLDYRPLAEDEPGVEAILRRPECTWLTSDLEDKAKNYAIAYVVPGHLKEVRDQKLDHIDKTEVAVKERLTKEINYWGHRADELRIQEQAGKVNARLNSDEARKRSFELKERMQKRIEELRLERQLSPLPPVILGSVLVVPMGLLSKMTGKPASKDTGAVDRQAVAARARKIVMEVERGLGFEPVDCETEKRGYDIESRVPGEGRLRFIEVKGRAAGASTLTVTRNEILYSLNKPESFILAMVEFLQDGQHRTRYLREPFNSEPDFGVTSVNYDFAHLLSRSEEPR